MKKIHIRLGDLEFLAQLEEATAPTTCTLFESLLPYSTTMIHACWSGEAGMILLDQDYKDLTKENSTNRPIPGQILFYTGKASEPKILFPYGQSSFNSKVGPLSGNHFLTIVEGLDRLASLDRLLLWQGAQQVSFQLAE